ncbi:MAG: prepilin peptidase [Candidatus Zixiibacteriota bacterium]
MTLITYIWVGLLGLAIGSFLNVVIYRLPRKIKFLLERSACPHCSTPLKWYHNIPLVSFAVLRGKCAFCHMPISWRYPVVESLNAAAYIYFLWQLGFSAQLPAYAFLSSVLIAIFFIDLEFKIIPDVLSLPGIVVGLSSSAWPGGIGFLNAAIGMVVGGGALYLIAMLGDWLFKKESMGGGDIKMAAMLGAFLGWQKILLVFFVSSVIGLLVALGAMSVSEKLRRHRVIPFGPFLALAAMLAVLYGDRLLGFYVHTLLAIP